MLNMSYGMEISPHSTQVSGTVVQNNIGAMELSNLQISLQAFLYYNLYIYYSYSISIAIVVTFNLFDSFFALFFNLANDFFSLNVIFFNSKNLGLLVKSLVNNSKKMMVLSLLMNMQHVKKILSGLGQKFHIPVNVRLFEMK